MQSDNSPRLFLATWRNLIHHAYPGDDFHDLNSGVDAMLAKRYIDREQLYVTGGSGGGVLSCWVIGHTDYLARRLALARALSRKASNSSSCRFLRWYLPRSA